MTVEQNDALPQVSVVLLTWNRREEVLESLRRLEEAVPTGMPIETIVVDNGSTDGTADGIGATFRRVRVVRLAANIGASGWNAGFAEARGRWILSLDDDSNPEGAWLANVPGAFMARPSAGIIACRILRGPERRCLTSHWSAFRTSFIACGALFDRRVFDTIGMYDPRIFLYSHEKEFSLRVIEAGFDICYEPRFVVHHRAVRAHRSVARYVAHDMEDTVYRIVRYYPAWHVPLAMSMALGWNLKWRRTIGRSRWGGWWPVLSGAWRGVRKALPVRRPFTRDTRRRIAAIWRADFAAQSGAARWLARIAPRGFFW